MHYGKIFRENDLHFDLQLKMLLSHIFFEKCLFSAISRKRKYFFLIFEVFYGERLRDSRETSCVLQ